MAKPKASLTAALAQKPQVVAVEPAPVPDAKPKVNDDKTTTSVRLSPALLRELKILAAERQCRVNDLVLEGIRNVLALNGRKTAA